MTYQKFKDILPEWKRRKAAEIMGWKKSTSLLCNLKDDKFIHYKDGDIMIVRKTRGDSPYEKWFPDESLDQCRLLENKAKEAGLHKRYTGCVITFIGLNAYERDVIDFTNTLYLTSDQKLFCLFQAFGVDIKEMEER